MTYNYLEVNQYGIVFNYFSSRREMNATEAANEGKLLLKVDSLEPMVSKIRRRYTGALVAGVTDIGEITNSNFDSSPGLRYSWNPTASTWDPGEEEPTEFGLILTGRGRGASSDNDLAPSTILIGDLFSKIIDVSDLELFIPSNSTVIPYDGTLNWPWKFDTVSPAFNGTDFELQVRISSTTQIIAEVVVPIAKVVNQKIPLYLIE